jgi:hypothetical protein
VARGAFTYQQYANSLAAYKNCYQTISNAINLAGVKTADTGQVNWASVATEPTGFRDYEVFALGGPLQATAPIFIRFDYVGGSSAPGGVHVTVGTTTDGAGNLGGLLIARLALQTHVINTSTTHWVWAASDQGSYFTFQYALDPAATGSDGVGIFILERTRNADGAANGNGFTCWRWQANALTNCVYQGQAGKMFGAGPQPANADFNTCVLIPDLQNNYVTSATGGVTYAFPVHTYTPPSKVGGPSKALLLAYRGDFPRGQQVTVNHYGEDMTFIPLADAVNHPVPYMVGTYYSDSYRDMAPLLRWD